MGNPLFSGLRVCVPPCLEQGKVAVPGVALSLGVHVRVVRGHEPALHGLRHEHVVELVLRAQPPVKGVWFSATSLMRNCLYRATSLTRNAPPPQGPPKGPMHGPTVGSYGRPLSYERGTPVGCKHGLVGVSAGCSWGVGCRVKGPGLRALRGRGADDGGVRNLRGGVGGSRHLVREVEHDFRRRDVSLRVGVAVDVGVLVRVARVGGPGPAGWGSGVRFQGLEVGRGGR